jgi:hypothetical protein
MWASSGTYLVTSACHSPRNADLSDVATDLVRITHPFHPYRGREFLCIGERNTRAGKRLLLKFSQTSVRAIPAQWTDRACPDLEDALGEGRSFFRFADLMGLANLVERLGGKKSPSKR